MVNTDKLRGKIRENKLSIEAVAEKIGMNPSTLYRRLNGGGGAFTIGEADEIASLLNLSADELNKIFLLSMSHKCEKAIEETLDRYIKSPPQGGREGGMRNERNHCDWGQRKRNRRSCTGGTRAAGN